MSANVTRTLGVLGGMGPMATVDFLQKFVRLTPAMRDQDHVPLVVHFCPGIPDRTDAIAGTGPSPAQALVASALAIQRAHAGALVIPCNTAHAWYEDIASQLDIPLLHIVDAAVACIPGALRDAPIGLLGTSGTLQGGIYARKRQDIAWLVPDEDAMAAWVMPAIRAVKRNDIPGARTLVRQAIDDLTGRGARAIVLGCTELPLAAQQETSDVPLIDATEALARTALRWALSDARMDMMETLA